MARHNLDNVVSFEVTRTLRKRQFWIMTLVVPVFMAAVFALIVSSNQATESSVNAQSSARLTFRYRDSSGFVDGGVAAAMGGSAAEDGQRAIEDGGASWRLTVSDRGPGLDAKNGSEVFKVFVSTKPAGTGMGLPIAERIVRAHGGTLSLASRPGEPTRAVATFPKAG